MPDPDPRLGEAADVFRLLSLTNSLGVFLLLGDEGELCVGEICDRLGVGPRALARCLSALRASGVVDTRRIGSYVYYAPGGGPRGRLATAAIRALFRDG